MSDQEYEKAVLWVPDPSSSGGWIRRKVWAEPARKPKRPMGFGFAARRESDDRRESAE